MKICTSCGTTAETNAKRCPICGAVYFKTDSGNDNNNTVNKQKKADQVAAFTDDSNRLAELDFTDRRNEILLKIARPDIYRINAFRILEIPVTATPQEISSHLHKLEILEKLGETNQSPKGFLSLLPTPDIDARNEAQQRLGNPETRLIDELFWFWPLEAGAKDTDDEAITALKRSDFTGAVSIWIQHEETYSEANVSVHNLAVMFHVLALDIEYVQIEKLSPKQSQQKWNYWKQSYSRWQTLLNHEAFWSRVNKRILELKDPRLTTGTTRRLRAGLPFILLSINANLAIKAMEKGNKEEAIRQVSLINESGFSNTMKEIALRRAVMPVRDRIQICCTNTETEAKTNPGNSRSLIEPFITQTSPLLMTLDTILPPAHTLREAAHDEIASQIYDLVIAHTNKTKDWKEAVALLNKALKIAVGASVRKRIKENIKTAQENDELNTCWFCKRRQPEENTNMQVKMFGDVINDGTRVTWRHFSVTVPRCKQCKSTHNTNTTFTVLGYIAGIGLAILAGVNANALVGFIVFCVCVAAGYLIPAALKPKGVKSESYYKEHPAVKELLAQGWQFGEKPSGVQ